MDYKELFEPGEIGKYKVKNRIIMAPMGNINMADPIGRPLPKIIEYFIERARGGTGLLITGLIPVSYGIDPTISEDVVCYFRHLQDHGILKLLIINIEV